MYCLHYCLGLTCVFSLIRNFASSSLKLLYCDRTTDHKMNYAALARRSQDLMDYTLHFCFLAIRSPYDDETIKSLYWIGANYYHQADLTDTLGESPFCDVWRGSTPDPSHHRTQSPAHSQPATEYKPEPTADGVLTLSSDTEPEHHHKSD